MSKYRKIFYGWKIVACAFLIALFGWGLGFYGPGIYLASFGDLYGWTASTVATAITCYYIASGIITIHVGDAFDRFGPRIVVTVGTIAMAVGLTALTWVTRPIELYGAFLIMSVGVSTMSGAAINCIVAPWFEAKRGLAISLALNGASAGGVVIAPLLILLIDAFGFAVGLRLGAAAMLIVLLPVVAALLHHRPADIGLNPDGAPVVPQTGQPAAPHRPWRRAEIFGHLNFWTIALPFALGLMAQVGFLTHQVAFLKPVLDADGIALAVALTTAAAIVGRVATGLVIDRVDRRAAACATFLLQAAAITLMVVAPGETALFVWCTAFGLGVGNLITLQGLIVQVEFPSAQFSRIVSLIIAISQFTFAFGPGVLGWLRDWQGSYTPALIFCVVLQVAAAAIVLIRRRAIVPADERA